MHVESAPMAILIAGAIITLAGWESALQPQLRKAEIQFYPPANPKQTTTLSLKWQEEWDEDIKKLVIAVQSAYERQKQGQP